MFCSKCGASYDLGDHFCVRCGAPTTGGGERPLLQEPAPHLTTSPSSEDKDERDAKDQEWSGKDLLQSMGPPDVFITLRFKEAAIEGKLLQATLAQHGVRAYIDSSSAGDDIFQNIAENLVQCKVAVILATQTYGKKTGGVFDTSREMSYILGNKKPYVLVKMCEEYEIAITKMQFGGNTVGFTRWMPGQAMPPELVDIIIGKVHACDSENAHAAETASPVHGSLRDTQIAGAASLQWSEEPKHAAPLDSPPSCQAATETQQPVAIQPVVVHTMDSMDDARKPSEISAQDIAGCWVCAVWPFICCAAIERKRAQGKDTLVHEGCCLPLLIPYSVPWDREHGNVFRNRHKHQEKIPYTSAGGPLCLGQVITCRICR